jgi:hypothetical protein
VAGAQAGESLACLRRAARGSEPDAQRCLSADVRGKIARARDRLASRAAKRCAPPLPPFGYASPAEIADHAEAEAIGLTADLFGPDLGAAAVARDTSKSDAACQAALAKDANALLATLFRLAERAKAEALQGGKAAPPVTDAGALGQAILDALGDAGSRRLGRVTGKLRRRAARKCGAADPAALLPGVCADAADADALASCAVGRARCRFCRALAGFDALPLDCDAFDDGADEGSCPAIIPKRVGSTPAEGEPDFAPQRWLQIDFASPFPEAQLGDLALRCDGVDQGVRTDASQGTRIFVIPTAALPANASCELRWPALDGSLAFSTGAADPFALYDRTDASLIAPFPDDNDLGDDPTTPTGRRIAFEAPPFDGLLGAVARGIAQALTRWDGFSPEQPLVLEFSDAPDPATLPLDAAASLEPTASIGLFDVDPASPGFGERVPFTGELRSDPAGPGATDHSLILYPAVDLEAGGHYALVVTREAHALGGGAFQPSGFFEQVLLPDPGPPAVERARSALAPVLDVLEHDLSPPILPADVALAVSITTRSSFFDPSDWVAVKEQLLAAPPPVLDVTSAQVSADQVVYRGTVDLPLWVEDPSLTEVTRDPGGTPVSLATEPVPFVFRVPTGVPTPMPIIIYQHGSPGSPEEIVGNNNKFLIDAGYAMIGIQDLTNRRFGQDETAQTTETIGRLAFLSALPLTNFETHADMLALLRAIQGMGTAGNFPEIDPTRILYKGISFGAHHSLGFLPLAPEVIAAVSHVGSGRLYHANLHQLDYQNLLGNVLLALPGARPRDVIAGFAALQNEQDRDDPAQLARYLYRQPLAISGLADTTPPSLLWIEGIGDSLVPNVATRASAVALGIPTLRPVADSSPVLTEVDAPLSENIAAGVTAGHFQYDPATTPSCVTAGQTEGHFCAQIADEAKSQVLHFFATALSGAAEIVDPLP